MHPVFSFAAFRLSQARIRLPSPFPTIIQQYAANATDSPAVPASFAQVKTLYTASVEAIVSDGSMPSIYCPAVDDELNLPVARQTELDWLLFNEPMEYVLLLLSGEVYHYPQAVPEHGMEDS